MAQTLLEAAARGADIQEVLEILKSGAVTDSIDVSIFTGGSQTRQLECRDI